MTALTIEAQPRAQWEDGYDLPEEEVNRLTAELLEERPPIGNERFVCYMIENDEPYAKIAQKIECEVFEAVFNNTPDVMRREYGPYEQQSTFFISVDSEERVPRGALRIIKNGPNGFKTFVDLHKDDPHFSEEAALSFHKIDRLDECWDIGTVAVPSRFRNSQVRASLQLYRGMYVISQREGVKHFISMIDERPHRELTNTLGLPFVHMHSTSEEPIDYLGSKSIPVYGDAPTFIEAVRSKEAATSSQLARRTLAILGRGTMDSTLQF